MENFGEGVSLPHIWRKRGNRMFTISDIFADEEISKQNISKMQLAKRCGIDKKMLYNPKRSNRYIRLVYLARICSALRVSADYLLFGE